MKRFLLILGILAGSAAMVFAQDQGGDAQNQEKRIQALYVAYVTQQLQLTPDEAQKFWPVHTQFATDLKTIRRDLPELEKQQARLDIKKRYQENFNRIIGPNRCDRFFRMESEFRKKLIEKMNDNPRQNQQRPKRRG